MPAPGRYAFSFDMLGRAPRTAADADRNFRAIWTHPRHGQRSARAEGIWRERLEIREASSVHPRYDAASYAQVRGELLDRLKQILGGAAAAVSGSRSTPRIGKLVSSARSIEGAGGIRARRWRAGSCCRPISRRSETVDALLQIAGRRRKRGGMRSPCGW